ncbi:MAG TPA: hypothetical protein VFG68_08740 [Fimbriiglobus sp.]|nr:hypothetical protein [Fimbriiglobus sp.]
MKTFDLAEVRDFAAALGARMDRCDNGEGMECSSLDDTLRHYAALCCEFHDGVRQWGQAVFSGRTPFNPDVERVLKAEAERLYTRAVATLAYGQSAEASCYSLDGQDALRSALWDLYLLLDNWVTPKLAVGPAARLRPVLDPAEVEDARRRIEALPSLPADWQPGDLGQQKIYRKLKSS